MSDNVHRTLMYVEIDIDYCANIYGESPCEAAIGVTGEKRCFNTFKTCQDKPHFINQPKTLRYAEATEYLPGDVECIPSLIDISYTPQQIDPGRSIGDRASITATFSDHPHSDTDLDKYVALRDYDPFEQGTYWAKFRARNPYIIGRNFRLIMGTDDQVISEMETRHFIIESTSGPGSGGTFKIVAKDILKITDGDRAQAPAKSSGELLDDIDDSQTTFTLDPPGIGDEYPSSGIISIGEEVMSFTRAGDAFTVVREQMGTDPSEHNSGDLVQLALVFDAITVNNIIAFLLVYFANCPTEYIPFDEWAYESSTYIDRVYSAVIAKPTAVNDLINELIEQAGLVIWWDDLLRQIKFRSLRPVAPTADIITDDQMIEGTFNSKDQPEKRASQVWVSFAQINPLEDLTRESNYASGVLEIDAQSEIDNGQPAIKKIFSRWMPRFARSTATRVGAQILSRYRDPPREFSFAVDRFQQVPQLGRGYRLVTKSLQKDTGEPDVVPMIIQSLEPEFDRITVKAEEMIFFDQGGLETTKLIVIDQDSTNVVLRSAYDHIYSTLADDEEVQIIIEHGVIVGSVHNAYAAMYMGSWPPGVTLTLVNHGRIQGRGGAGGGPLDVGAVRDGGLALAAERPITIDNSDGEIWGGGGGGGGAIESGATDVYVGGGGGAGYQPGAAGPNNFGPSKYASGASPSFDNGEAGDHDNPLYGQYNLAGASAPGTTEAGGMRGGAVYPGKFREHPGKGGDPGVAGEPGRIWNGPQEELVTTQNGGNAGAAVAGNSNVTWTATGDRRGAIT